MLRSSSDPPTLELFLYPWLVLDTFTAPFWFLNSRIHSSLSLLCAMMVSRWFLIRQAALSFTTTIQSWSNLLAWVSVVEICTSKVHSTQSNSVSVTQANRPILDWHRSLGHIGLKSLKTFLKQLGLALSVSDEIVVQQCPVCVESKMARFSFKSRSDYRASLVEELVHSDVCSFEVPSCEG